MRFPCRPPAGALLAGAASALCFLAACEDRDAAPAAPPPPISKDTPADLKHMRFAVASFIGSIMLEDRARTDLAAQAFTVLPDDDRRLQDPAVAKDTLWFTFREQHISGSGMAVEMVAKDVSGTEMLHARARRSNAPTALDALVAALAPYRTVHAPPPPHHLIEL